MENIYCALLSRVPGIGAKKFYHLLAKFGSACQAWNAETAALEEALGNHRLVHNLLELREKLDENSVKTECSNLDMKVICYSDSNYPEALKSIYDPPPVLYVKGQINNHQVKVSMIGSRRCSSYGRAAAEKIASDLAEQGICIVSGMARGIDTSAHRGACRTGNTIAVMGCGLDICYPPENHKLMDEIVERGAVISEFAPGTPPLPLNFPARNRIISGISSSVVVIEAGEKSGALITVDCALEQGRDVYVVPGSILTDYSKGSHTILKQGAKLLDDANELLRDMGMNTSREDPEQQNLFPPLPALTEEEQRALLLLSQAPVDFETLAVKSQFSVGQLTYLLINLEMKGYVKALPGKRYVQVFGG